MNLFRIESVFEASSEDEVIEYRRFVCALFTKRIPSSIYKKKKGVIFYFYGVAWPPEDIFIKDGEEYIFSREPIYGRLNNLLISGYGEQ
jgi:hypothetical protein